MNPANIITTLRLALIFFVLIGVWRYDAGAGEIWRIAAVWIAIAASVTDFLDGFVARKFNYVSKTGAIYDPIVDKIGCVAAIILLAMARNSFEAVMLWYPSVIIAKELITIIGSVLLRKKAPPKGFKPLVLGKISAFLQAMTIIWLLLKAPQGYIIITISGVIAFLAGVAYIYLGITLFYGGGIWGKQPLKAEK